MPEGQHLSLKKMHGTIKEYLTALNASPRFGPQVICQREIAGKKATWSVSKNPWPLPLQKVIDSISPEGVYCHQAEAIDLVRNGNSVIVATPTASGKTLIYNLPVMENLIKQPDSHALYLFPLKALAQDQLRAIEEMVEILPADLKPTAAIYDGDTSAYRRKKIRDLTPQILISNPDILHLSMLGYHDLWASFWSKLTYVIIDEVHTYRGVFGSHMAWVLRRLRRICARYGREPVFIMSSATVGNPQQLAEDLLGRPVKTVTESGAPRGTKQIVLFDPYEGPAYAASQLLEAALKRGLRTIVYTQSRKMTELISLWTSSKLGLLKDKLTSYRAGFLPEERRDIEAKLSNGKLLGVVSTSALELGVDIGELEICILVGYPGSMMATWQRSGRVGRRQHESLVVMVAQEDALDQHFMRNPDDFFNRKVEPAVLNPGNKVIIKQHLLCAATEGTLAADDLMLGDQDVADSLYELSKEGKLLLSGDGSCWISSRKYPHRQVELRGSGRGYAIRRKSDNELLGEVDGGRCFKECHPGAVFLQKGRTLMVEELDLEGSQVRVNEKKVHFFTKALSNKHTEILQVFESKSLRNFTVSFGSLRVTDQVTGYQRRLLKGHKLIGTHQLDLPPSIFETQGVWFHIPAAIQEGMEHNQMHFMGGIHALEHAAIGIFPLLVLCDRNDVGGISIPFHPQVGGAAVFIYDGYSGGIGLCRKAYHEADKLLLKALDAIESCHCDTGCPSCVHSPKCGSGNRPIDKMAARTLLRAMLQNNETIKTPFRQPVKKYNRQDDFRLPEHYLVFDLETKRSAAEVGGWHRAAQMGISAAVAYDSLSGTYLTFMEDEIDCLIDKMQNADLVVGFNNKRFDNQVLSAYSSFNLSALPTLDILEVVYTRLGYRLSLDRLAEHTLGAQKSANGLMALQWFKQGKMKEIVDYCREDVKITKDLLLFGVENRYLLFKNKAGSLVRCPFIVND